MNGKQTLILDNHPLFIEAMAGEEIDYPERLTLEMTSYCNLKCWMCPKTAGHVNTPQNRVIEGRVVEEVKKILPKIEVLQLSGLWGEVFLHPEVYLNILKDAKEAGCVVSTISNGTLLKKEIAEKLVSLGLDNLTISIDAATPETYKRIRVGGDFKTLIKNLKRLQKIKKKKKSERPAVQFAFVGMKQNIDELPGLVKLAASLGVKSVILQGMGEYEDTEGESLTYHHRELGKEVYEKAAELGRRLGVDVGLFPPDQFEESSVHLKPVRGELIEDWKIPAGFRKACKVPWEEVVITTSGDVLPCCAASTPLGNILESPFEELWVSEPYRSFRRQILSENPPLMCKACTGMGWRAVVELKDFFTMGKTDDQLGLGWYWLEANDEWGTYRWSKPRATFFLKNSGAEALELTMRVAGLPKEGEVRVNGIRVGEFSLRESVWKPVRFSLPPGSRDALKVEIFINNASREGGDQRVLGVALSEARLR